MREQAAPRYCHRIRVFLHLPVPALDCGPPLLVLAVSGYSSTRSTWVAGPEVVLHRVHAASSGHILLAVQIVLRPTPMVKMIQPPKWSVTRSRLTKTLSTQLSTRARMHVHYLFLKCPPTNVRHR